MPNQYDELGPAYHEVKKIPLFRCLDATVQKHLGDIQGFRVLDLACGGGDYSRKLISWGAEHVTGVDLSPGMIESARKLTADENRIEYLVADCSKPLADIPKASFDLVIGVYFLNYASSRQEMTRMWENIHAYLKPGARFLGVKPTWNPEDHAFDSYGITGEVLERFPGGFSRRTWLGDKKVNFVNFVLEWDIYVECARVSGMAGLQALPLILPKGEENDEFWKPMIEEPLFEVITAVKP